MSPTKLLVVKHPPQGEGEAGTALCGEIRALLISEQSRLVLFHDATEMLHATPDYAKAFMKLDGEIADRVVQIVCAIPRPVPRMMAWTVAVVSSRDWKIFKSADEAAAHLTATGFALPTGLAPGVRAQIC